MFSFRKTRGTPTGTGFSYLSPETLYFDSACQTLRPQEVIDAEVRYYQEYNACGGRVKYPWGERIDREVNETREAFLRYLGKSSSEYFVAFTLNTTYGINLVLSQLRSGVVDRVVTSEIEHNSVFLPTMTFAKKHGIPRTVCERDAQGHLLYTPSDLERALVLVNSTSNIDGRTLGNGKALAKEVHAQGGYLFLDAAQSLGHSPSLLQDIDYDVLFGSVHKMYGPSLGVLVMKKSLLPHFDFTFVGGGMVTQVGKESYTLYEDPSDYAALFEPGLQAWGAIVGARAALAFLTAQGKQGLEREHRLAERLYQGMKELPVTLLNTEPSSTLALYAEKADAHRLALYLGQQGVMLRSGYFCCHYYLQEVRALPPLLRFSLGLQTTEEQVDRVLVLLGQLLKNL
jgi:cysteine desulfurase/selenocysteine lyase